MPLQQLDSAVDGSDVYVGVGLLDLFVDLFGRHVPGAGGDGREDHHPLGSEAVTLLPEDIQYLVNLGHSSPLAQGPL